MATASLESCHKTFKRLVRGFSSVGVATGCVGLASEVSIRPLTRVVPGESICQSLSVDCHFENNSLSFDRTNRLMGRCISITRDGVMQKLAAQTGQCRLSNQAGPVGTTLLGATVALSGELRRQVLLRTNQAEPEGLLVISASIC